MAQYTLTNNIELRKIKKGETNWVEDDHYNLDRIDSFIKGPNSTIKNHIDVDNTMTPSDGDIFVFNGSEWTNDKLQLSDFIDFNGIPNEGDTIVFKNDEWMFLPMKLNSLLDVDDTDAESGDFLMRNNDGNYTVRKNYSINSVEPTPADGEDGDFWYILED